MEGRHALQRFNIGDDIPYLKWRTNPELPLWNNMFRQTDLKPVPIVPFADQNIDDQNIDDQEEIVPIKDVKNKSIPKLKNKTPKYNSNDVSNISPWQRALPHVLGLGAALNKYGHWKSNPVTYHSTYAANPYLNRALSIMAQNRISPYSAIKEALDAERRAAYRLN